MVKSKIFYDSVIRNYDEWVKSINRLSKEYPEIHLPEITDFAYLDAVQSHYFAIFSAKPIDIRLQLRNQLKSNLGKWLPIVWDATLDSAKNSEFYRIDVPREIIIYRKNILDRQSAWIKDKTLHSKGPKAIRNLIERLEKK